MTLIAIFLPLLGAFITGFFGRNIGDRGSQLITSGFMIITAGISINIFYNFLHGAEPYILHLFRWVDIGNFTVNWAIKIDTLTAVMLLVVNIISMVVHIYSIGYMANDASKPRFMCYLSLFTFFMLMLISSDNLVQLFFGWEGVGLCSYLLIGFWFEKPAPNAAAMKAFLVNRVGDFGFALGICGVFLLFGSVNYEVIFSQAANYQDSMMNFWGYEFHAMTLVCVLLFIGAMGKSAQIGLHTWLPDAMEGPTPVSALIHAATMVTAGVFMICRLSPLFEYAPDALMIITIIGGTTAIFAATIGITQNDIKRVIAYSTCSQLGYMFFAAGVSAYSAAIFHLMTHAFFKALLFLGSGSVIHAMSGEQDMRNMGGIWKFIPTTYTLMWIGSLALAGIPLFAGFYSKDLIIEAAFASGSSYGIYAFWMGVAAALLTAFYSWRLIFMTFHGKPRAHEKVMAHIHESPKIMIWPLYILAFGAIFSGWWGYDIFTSGSEFWGSSIFVLPKNDTIEAVHDLSNWVKFIPLIFAIIGIGMAVIFYVWKPYWPQIWAEKLNHGYLFLKNKWYFDELYNFIFIRQTLLLGRIFWRIGDGAFIDGLGPNGMAAATIFASKKTSQLQSGYLYHYAFVMFLGILLIVSWLFYTLIL